jgi:hypothetical protein
MLLYRVGSSNYAVSVAVNAIVVDIGVEHDLAPSILDFVRRSTMYLR